jgi:hypothetical protein
VPTEERDRIAENVVSNLNALSGRFIELWKELEVSLRKAVSDGDSSARTRPVISILNELYSSGLIENDQFSEGGELNHFRNRLLHDANASIGEQDLAANIARLSSLIRAIRGSWKDEIMNAIQALGGKATLSEIYSYIEKNTHRSLPESWQANIRNALQTHSSDTNSYQGRQDTFRRLDRGLWGLREIDES